MDDKLSILLEHFSLRARVFQAGLVCRSGSYDTGNGLGYIHVLRSGPLRVSATGKKPVTLTEPSLLFYMSPGNTHHLRPLSDNVDMVCASFDFGTDLNNPLSHAVPEGIILRLEETKGLSACLQLLFVEAQEKDSGQQPLLDRLMEVVIIQLLRELIDQKHLQLGLLAGLADLRLAKAINAMHAKPASSWTLLNLSKVAGMSRGQFSKVFKNTLGITVGQYLNNWRISVAQSLLKKGKPLPQVADDVGYSNASALSRAFVATVGTSPAKWKKQN